MQILKSFSKIHVYYFVVLGLAFLISSDALAITDAEFKEEIEKAEKLITGGYLRLGALVVCIVSIIYGIIKQNFAAIAVCIAGCLILFMMKGWITTNFAALI